MSGDEGYGFYRRCTKRAYDEFTVNIQVADELIKNLAPVEVWHVSGSFQQ